MTDFEMLKDVFSRSNAIEEMVASPHPGKYYDLWISNKGGEEMYFEFDPHGNLVTFFPMGAPK
jgi:hypothetical protein